MIATSVKILVLFAKSGSLGHAVVAHNFARLLETNGYQVKTHDVFQLEHSRRLSVFNNLYFWIIKNVPYVWRWLYRNWRIVPLVNWFRLHILPRYFKKSIDSILNYQADIIITTHPTATSIVNYLKGLGRVSGKLFTTFSDWHTQDFWVFPNVDKYFVLTMQQKNDLMRRGFREDQIEITGVLLSESFYHAPSKAEARKLLKIPEGKKVVLVMGGGSAWGIEQMMQSLKTVKTRVHLLVIAGSDFRKKQIKQYVQKKCVGLGDVEVSGFTDPTLHFAASDLLISKPGGLTTSQAFLLRLPFVIPCAVPGQEEENSKRLAERNAVFVVKDDKNLSTLVDDLLRDPDKLSRVVASFSQLAHSKTPEKILNSMRQAIKQHNGEAN